MKTNFTKMLTMFGLATTAMIGTLHAQNYQLTAKVPFAFQAGSQTFEAGKYEVGQGFSQASNIRNTANGHRVFLAGAYASLSGTSEPKLVFHCYAGQNCFLAEIWPGRGNGMDVPVSKAEKSLMNGEHAKEMATIAIDLRRAD